MGGKFVDWNAVTYGACETGVPIRGVARECVGIQSMGTIAEGAVALILCSQSAAESLLGAREVRSGTCTVMSERQRTVMGLHYK
jgi:hypothetical protein